ncbi:MAG: helix-turn-helix domain-containing protein, partial [Clostridia bacterium]|nr:helix-turn-helix domain-containing protein [Clostridia bacterium]
MKTFSLSKLAATVLAQRKALRITQEGLAEKTGINRSLLSRLEKEDYVPSLEQLVSLSNVLEFDLASLFPEKEEPDFAPADKAAVTVYGAGYVGLSIAVLLSRFHHVTLVDVIPEKVDSINRKASPIQDEYIEKYLAEENLDLTATLDGENACKGADFVVIAAPTNYDPKKNFFDTSAVENVIETVLKNAPDAMMVIKSTVPVGYAASVRAKYNTKNILFSPEFLRESKSLYDNLYPIRIIVGCDEETKDKAQRFAELLRTSALKKDVEVLLMCLTEAEAVKLFANTYLALRVSYFNELDTYAESKGLSTRDIIR